MVPKLLQKLGGDSNTFCCVHKVPTRDACHIHGLGNRCHQLTWIETIIHVTDKHGKWLGQVRSIRLQVKTSQFKRRIILNELKTGRANQVVGGLGQPLFSYEKKNIFRENESNQSRKQIAHNTLFFFSLSGHLLLLDYLCYYYTCEGKKTNKPKKYKTFHIPPIPIVLSMTKFLQS